MDRIHCPQCGLSQPAVHLYCIACGVSLPSHLLPDAQAKSARFFAGVPVADGDPQGAFLRVSCYLKEQTFTSAEGAVTIPGRHVRFSVWVGDEARCVLSIPETEAVDLARFIAAEMRPVEQTLADRPA